MPFHFQFSTIQILWTLTFASLLVLLVVLLGRDRAKRYPLFTFSVCVVALRLLVSRLLFGRLTQMALSIVFYSLSVLAALAGVLVAIELARRAFAEAGRRAWLTGTLLILAVAGTVMWLWGPWPAWHTLTAGGAAIAALHFVELAGQRGDSLASLLAVEVGILVALFGRRFQAGWRSHTQQIALGLSTVALAQLAVRGVWQAIALKAQGHIHSQADYDRVIGIQTKLYNANNAIYICVLIWWIVCLWRDEPGTAAAPAASDPEHVDPVAVWNEEGGK